MRRRDKGGSGEAHQEIDTQAEQGTARSSDTQQRRDDDTGISEEFVRAFIEVLNTAAISVVRYCTQLHCISSAFLSIVS